jgi:hypothetical protein
MTVDLERGLVAFQIEADTGPISCCVSFTALADQLDGRRICTVGKAEQAFTQLRDRCERLAGEKHKAKLTEPDKSIFLASADFAECGRLSGPMCVAVL